MKHGLTELQEKFVELMLDDRIYTNRQMAEILGCDERTIYKMKRNPKVVKAIEEKADTALTANIGKAYKELEAILFNPKVNVHAKIKALDLYLKTQGKLKEKSEAEVQVNVAKNAEEAEKELDRLLGLED
jgi:hypothetical protein